MEKVITKIFTMNEQKTGHVADRCCGFTIVELLMVIVLIVLLTGAVGGLYVGTYKRALVKKTAFDFLMAAKYARILAIEQQRNCSVVIDEVNKSFSIVLEGGGEVTEGEVAEEGEPQLVRDLFFKPVKLPDGVEFESVVIDKSGYQGGIEQEDKNEIVFSRNGTANEAVIEFGDGNTHFTATVSAGTGKTKVFEGTAENIKQYTVDLDQS